MRLRALIVVLASVLAGLMAVVIVRAQTTNLHYALSRLDQQAAALKQEVREKDLELARLRNPALIHAKLDEMRARQETAEVEAADRRPNEP